MLLDTSAKGQSHIPTTVGVVMGGVMLSVLAYLLGVATRPIIQPCTSYNRNSNNAMSKHATPVTKLDLTPKHTEHTHRERNSQGHIMYEDILPAVAKDEDIAIKVEKNIEYRTHFLIGTYH